jgi:hypothetical protein
MFLAQVVRVLAADAVGFQELRGHGGFQLPDHGDGAVALKTDAAPAAQELERGR